MGNNDKYASMQVGSDTDWRAIAAGWGHTVGIQTDGTFWTWGGNDRGQLGNGTSGGKEPRPVEFIE